MIESEEKEKKETFLESTRDLFKKKGGGVDCMCVSGKVQCLLSYLPNV